MLCAKKSEIGSPSGHSSLHLLDRVLHTEGCDAEYSRHCRRRDWQLVRLWTVWRSGNGADRKHGPISKLMQLLQPGKQEAKPPEKSAAKSEAKPPEKSAAKHSSKAHPAAKKRASTKPASKEATLNGAPQVAALPSELVFDGEAMRVASPNDADDIDLTANAQGALASDASPAAATIVKAATTETIAPADKSNFEAAAVSQTPSSSIGSLSWMLWVIAALSGAVATGSIAWFLIKPSASAARMGKSKRITSGDLESVHTILGPTVPEFFA